MYLDYDLTLGSQVICTSLVRRKGDVVASVARLSRDGQAYRLTVSFGTAARPIVAAEKTYTVNSIPEAKQLACQQLATWGYVAPGSARNGLG